VNSQEWQFRVCKSGADVASRKRKSFIYPARYHADTYVLIIFSSASPASSLDDWFRDCQACLSLSLSLFLSRSLSTRVVLRNRPRHVCSAARWKIAGDDEPRAPRNDRARAVFSRSASVFQLFPYHASKSPARTSLRFAGRVRTTRIRGNTKGKWRRRSESNGPPSPPVSAIDPAIDRLERNRQIATDLSRERSRMNRGYYRALSRALSWIIAPMTTFDLPTGRARTSLTRFWLSATWNEVSAPRVGSSLNIVTCLRRRSRKVWGERNGHFEAPPVDRCRWRSSENRPVFYLHFTCVTVTLSHALTWRGPGSVDVVLLRPDGLPAGVFLFSLKVNRHVKYTFLSIGLTQAPGDHFLSK